MSCEPSAAPGRPLPWIWIWAGVLVLSVCGAAVGPIPPSLAVAVCLLAAGFDAATSRIPNQITYVAILLGLAMNGASELAPRLGAAGLMQSLAGLAFCAALGVVCVLLAGMGGGDMKLLAALGAILGFTAVGFVLLCALAVAVVYAVANLLIAGRLNAVMRAAAVWLLQAFYLRQVVPVSAVSKSTIPLAVPLLLGLIASWMNFAQRLWHAVGM